MKNSKMLLRGCFGRWKTEADVGTSKSTSHKVMGATNAINRVLGRKIKPILK